MAWSAGREVMAITEIRDQATRTLRVGNSSKRPLMQASSPNHVDRGAADGDSGSHRQPAEGMRTIHKDEEESRHGGDGRKRVERNAERALQFRALHPEGHHPNMLQEELQQDARDHQHSDHLLESEKAEQRRHET